jgi:HSP20 family protein
MFYSLATRPSRSFQRQSAPLVSNGALESFLDDTIGSLSGSRSAHSATVEDGDKEQLDIGIEGDVVRVSSKADAPRVVKAAWRFPLEIDTAESSAKLEHGVLSLTLAKKIPVSNVTQLTIS